MKNSEIILSIVFLGLIVFTGANLIKMIIEIGFNF
jgi:hypothetical protein